MTKKIEITAQKRGIFEYLKPLIRLLVSGYALEITVRDFYRSGQRKGEQKDLFVLLVRVYKGDEEEREEEKGDVESS